MNDSAAQDNLELQVTDFGPIAHARIDLRPLTVFIGPSNTGKSYLAILIYALHRYFGDERFPFRQRASWTRRMFPVGDTPGLPRQSIDDLAEVAGRVLADTGELLSEDGIVLPDSVATVIRSELGRQGDHLGNEIGRCFGIDATPALIRNGATDAASIFFRGHNANESEPIDHRLTISTHGSEFGTVIPEVAPMRISFGDRDLRSGRLQHLAKNIISPGNREGEPATFYEVMLLEALTDHFRRRIVGPLNLPAFYLPADRTGVMHAHSAVVSALIESAAMTGLRRPAAGTPMLSGVLADFLEQLIEIDRAPYRRRKPRHDLSRRIEEAILRGSVSVDRSETIGYPRFTYRPEGWKNSLSLMNASSMVSELAPVVLYLRHMVRPGSVLIVEEPESHLHPAMQVEFTRQLATLVREGIRVVVTTHSDWVLDELANIVRRSEIPTAGQHGTIDGKIALRSDQVGAWLFKQNEHPKGSIVKEIELDDETGLYPTDYDVVSDALYNESANIYNRTPHGEAN